MDLTKLNFEVKHTTLSRIFEMIEKNELSFRSTYPNPHKPWTEEQELSFIELVLFNIPLSSIYLEFNEKTRQYDVIDGLQRLKSIRHFINRDNPLKLSNLELSDCYDSHTFDGLSFFDRMSIGLHEITVFVSRSQKLTDDERFILHNKINPILTRNKNEQ